MKVLTIIKKALLTVCFIGFAQAASSAAIFFDPTPALGDVGDTISVDLVWDGNPGEYLGDWDVDISYDDSIVSYVGSTFHFGVDSLGCIPFVTCDDASSPGLIDLFEVSFDDPATLIANQDGLGNNFVLATLEFQGLAVGMTDLIFGNSTFGDENGQAINPTLSNGKICVGPDGCVNVPGPSTLPLLSLGLIGLYYSRRRRTG